MSTVTAKVFRQQILKPAEGIFLFHARAIERLIEEQLGERLQGVSIPDLPYYLMPKEEFLFGLESENAEALSVIEGLRLPDHVILLPSPATQGLDERQFRQLRHDYWARGFEAEVARAWQMARDDNQDARRYGADALAALIGGHAYAEVKDVLDRDGVTLPIWEDALICRSFVAMVARLRYFAPGARGFYFPAINVWPEVDRWLTASGLDLPEPLHTSRLPMLLVRSRPGAGADLPTEFPLLPTGLPFGCSDPDLPRAIEAAQKPLGNPRLSVNPTPSIVAPVVLEPVSESSFQSASSAVPGSDAVRGDVAQAFEQRCLDALRRGSAVRRHRGWMHRLRDGVDGIGRRLLARLLFLPGIEDIGLGDQGAQGRRGRDLGLGLFEQAVSAAQRAEFDGRCALSLRHLAEARRLAQRLNRPARVLPVAVEQAICTREFAAEEQLAHLLAAKWKLDPATAAEIRTLTERLAAEDRRRYGSAPARALLGDLEQVLREGRSDYYRLRVVPWLLSLGRIRLREVLPFQSLLKALRSLETGRMRLEELLWPIADLERFSRALSTLTDRVNARLDAQITPRVERAMREADFVPRDHRETVAAQKMKLELLDVIKHRRHLKFTDVRDIVARNILRLPDPTIDEFFRGDRLRRFDRTASQALPGVYRPGELYIKGLQQLSAPLFGTNPGRSILRHVLLPFGSAYLVLKSLDLLIELLPNYDRSFHVTSLVSVALIGALVNGLAFSGIGRHLVRSLWHGSLFALRFLLYDGLRRLLRWGPVATLLKTGLVRGLGRNLFQPLLIGTLPLIPIIWLAVFVDHVPIEPGLWLVGLAFALGTLARHTPAGRRFVDDLSTGIGSYVRRVNQTLFIGAVQQLMYFFKELTRRFSQILHRVEEALTHHLGEHPASAVAKAVLAPLWRLAESLIQFYVTVLVEPQVNPVKHFPIVTIGHKLMLPFLPAITAAFLDVSQAVLPKVIAFPLVTLTVLLLPGLFGFLVWELKENWKLYQANHRGGLQPTDSDEVEPAGPSPVEPAVVGSHGETMRGLMSRGFHSGTLPKGFDRLRKVIRDEIRDEIPYPKRLRRVQRQLEEVQQAVCVFFERECTFALRERCRDPDCMLQRIETGTPRIATNLVELQAELYADALPATETNQLLGEASSQPLPGPSLLADPLRLRIRISHAGQGMRVETEIEGCSGHIDPHCWSLISDDLRLFAGRAGADLRGSEWALPMPCDAGGPAVIGTPSASRSEQAAVAEVSGRSS